MEVHHNSIHRRKTSPLQNRRLFNRNMGLVSCRLKPEDFFNQGFAGALSEFPEVSHILNNLEQLRILQEENLWIESASWIEN
jgi:hypothetical protein